MEFKGGFAKDLEIDFRWHLCASSKQRCFVCESTMHLANSCPHRSSNPQANYTVPRYIDSSQGSVPDTGASHHIAPDLASFNTSEPYNGSDRLQVASGKLLNIAHIGTSVLNSSSRSLALNNILHVPHSKKHLLSVQKFCLDNNVYFEFFPFHFVIKDQVSHRPLLSGTSNHGLYQFHPRSSPSSGCVSLSSRVTMPVWHHRLGHPNDRTMRRISDSFCLGSKFNSSLSSTSCPMGKLSKIHLPLSNKRSTMPLELIFSDLWGPAPTLSNGYRYFVIFVDDFCRFVWFYPLVYKSDALDVFKSFQVLVERQFETKIKSVQTDWGGEYRSCNKYFQTVGIHHRVSCPHTHEQMGRVERRHRHIIDTGLTLLSHAKLDMSYWYYAFETSVYLINRLPTPVNQDLSAFELLFHRFPDYSFLRSFGCLCFPYLRPYNAHKCTFHYVPCIFLGYSPSHNGYRCLDLKSKRLYVVKFVKFFELDFPCKNSDSSSDTSISGSNLTSSCLPYVSTSLMANHDTLALPRLPLSQAPHIRQPTPRVAPPPNSTSPIAPPLSATHTPHINHAVNCPTPSFPASPSSFPASQPSSPSPSPLPTTSTNSPTRQPSPSPPPNIPQPPAFIP
ncbi:hypothetical protein LIER_40268 [Lithospermum erythrorhizon]|uniref:Integrase catalytic domain-containing protein n=1 Tax=Lithospermum erythrorhizon TaxID=34254 RepID=A0AAV3QS22_LITER